MQFFKWSWLDIPDIIKVGEEATLCVRDTSDLEADQLQIHYYSKF